MDIKTNGKTIHLPAEIVDNIVSRLYCHDGLRNIRLVNKVFNSCAIQQFCRADISPSELFVLPAGVQEYTDEPWPYFLGKRLRIHGDFAIWTSLPISPDIKLEDGTTDEGCRFEELLTATRATRYDDDSSEGHDASYDNPEVVGSTCWGRIVERPDHIWILQQFDDHEAWDYYRSSIFAKNMKAFRESIAPSCVQNSRSERMSIRRPRWMNSSLPGFGSYYEMRTFYFPTDLTKAHQEALSQVLNHNPRPLINTRVPSRKPCTGPGHKEWSWLSGFRVYEGKRAVALRIMINWRTPDIESRYKKMHADYKERGVPYKDWPYHLQQLQALEDANALGYESYHCHFERRPL